MKDSELIKQSIKFSVSIVEYYKWLVYDKKELIVKFDYETLVEFVKLYLKKLRAVSTATITSYFLTIS